MVVFSQFLQNVDDKSYHHSQAENVLDYMRGSREGVGTPPP